MMLASAVFERVSIRVHARIFKIFGDLQSTPPPPHKLHIFSYFQTRIVTSALGEVLHGAWSISESFRDEHATTRYHVHSSVFLLPPVTFPLLVPAASFIAALATLRRYMISLVWGADHTILSHRTSLDVPLHNRKVQDSTQRQAILSSSVVFVNSSTKILGYYFELGYTRFLSHSFQHITHKSCHHSKLHSLGCWRRRLIL